MDDENEDEDESNDAGEDIQKPNSRIYTQIKV